MNEQEMKQVQDLVDCLKKDDRLKGEHWKSLTYWNRGVGVALRRYKFYEEHLRINGNLIDFHLYIQLSDGLTVFRKLTERMPSLLESVKRQYPSIAVEYTSEPAKDHKTQATKGSMVLAHFYVPLGNMEMLRDVFVAVYNACKNIERGSEVKPRSPRENKEGNKDDDLSMSRKTHCKSSQHKTKKLRAGLKFDGKTCRWILSMLQRKGAELIGDGVRRPLMKGEKKSISLCKIGDVLFSLDFGANQVEAKLTDSTSDRARQFQGQLGMNGDSVAYVKKLGSDVLNQGQINPSWIDDVIKAYQNILGRLTSGDHPFLYKKFDWRRKQFDPPEQCLKIVDELERSLLFAMSHGSHELFHTNVWAWLVKTHPEFAKVFFDDIDVGAIKEVRREQGSRDLTIWVDVNGVRKAYVVENKFKSSARENQLIEYKNALADSFADGLLVTLDKLPKWFGLPEGWKSKQQSNIVNAVRNLLDEGHYDEKDPELGLVATYADITSRMSDLFNAYREKLGDHWALALNHSEWDEVKSGDLESIRLADIFKKMNASDFKAYIEKTSAWENLRSRVKKARSDLFDLTVTTDFLHKLPVVNCDISYEDANGYKSLIGIILQGNSFGRDVCSFAECWTKKDSLSKIYEMFKGCCWFDDSSFLRPALSLKKRSEKKYKQYATADYSFVYQDIGIENDTFEYLAKLVVENMKKAVELLEQGKLDNFFGISGV